MVTHTIRESQNSPSTDTAEWSTPHPPGPLPDPFTTDIPRCPTCGHAALPFDVRLSGLLDLIHELDQALRLVKRAAEEAGL
jgi:hypothetical protein